MEIRAKRLPWARVLTLTSIALVGGIILLVTNTASLSSTASELLDLAEATTGINYPVVLSVSLTSTITERLILFVVIAAAFAALAISLRRNLSSRRVRLLATAGCTAALLLSLFLVFPPTNLANGFTSESIWPSLTWAAIVGMAFAVFVDLAGNAPQSVRGTLLGIVVAAMAGMSALIPSGIRLFETGSRYLFAEDAVTDISPDSRSDFGGAGRDMNGLAIDTVRRRLFADGHGVNNIFLYNLDAPEEEPQISQHETGGAESLTYNDTDGEIYVYSLYDPQLLIFDGATLTLKTSMPNVSISPGDVLVGWDARTRRIVLSSEADDVTPDSLVILERDTGKVVYKDQLGASSLAVHPLKSWVYFSFYRDVNAVFAFDLVKNDYVARQDTDLKRLDGIAIDESAKQILVASPLRSEILRFDQDTLTPGSAIPAMFGVRTVALDTQRNLIVCVSLVTGYLGVIDAKTDQVVASYRVAPWLRSVVLDPKAGKAYVTSNYGLFVVDYLKRISPSPVAQTTEGQSVHAGL